MCIFSHACWACGLLILHVSQSHKYPFNIRVVKLAYYCAAFIYEESTDIVRRLTNILELKFSLPKHWDTQPGDCKKALYYKHITLMLNMNVSKLLRKQEILPIKPTETGNMTTYMWYVGYQTCKPLPTSKNSNLEMYTKIPTWRLKTCQCPAL